MAPPGIEAKKVDFPSTPEARLRVSAPSPPTRNTATVAARMAEKLAPNVATTVGVKYSDTAEPRITCPIWRAQGGECMGTPSKLSVATAIIGPIIQGIGVCRRWNR